MGTGELGLCVGCLAQIATGHTPIVVQYTHPVGGRAEVEIRNLGELPRGLRVVDEYLAVPEADPVVMRHDGSAVGLYAATLIAGTAYCAFCAVEYLHTGNTNGRHR